MQGTALEVKEPEDKGKDTYYRGLVGDDNNWQP